MSTSTSTSFRRAFISLWMALSTWKATGVCPLVSGPYRSTCETCGTCGLWKFNGNRSQEIKTYFVHCGLTSLHLTMQNVCTYTWQLNAFSTSYTFLINAEMLHVIVLSILVILKARFFFISYQWLVYVIVRKYADCFPLLFLTNRMPLMTLGIWLVL